VDHTSQYEQVAKGPRCANRHVCQKCPDDVFQEHNRHKHHFFMKQEEEHSPSIDYIFFAMSDNLEDQTSHAKVFSSHSYEKKKLMERMTTQNFQTCTTW
jgi:hypothetical protein